MLAVAGVGVVGATGGVAGAQQATSAIRASAARTESISESASLHLTSKHGLTLNEEGSAEGSIRGKIYIHLHLQEGSHVSAEVNIYPSDGSLSGYGSASYVDYGADARFSGSLSITRGTGAYRGARAAGMSFTGTIQRRGYAVSVRLSGRLDQ